MASRSPKNVSLSCASSGHLKFRSLAGSSYTFFIVGLNASVLLCGKTYCGPLWFLAFLGFNLSMCSSLSFTYFLHGSNFYMNINASAFHNVTAFLFTSLSLPFAHMCSSHTLINGCYSRNEALSV